MRRPVARTVQTHNSTYLVVDNALGLVPEPADLSRNPRSTPAHRKSLLLRTDLQAAAAAAEPAFETGTIMQCCWIRPYAIQAHAGVSHRRCCSCVCCSADIAQRAQGSLTVSLCGGPIAAHRAGPLWRTNCSAQSRVWHCQVSTVAEGLRCHQLYINQCEFCVQP
jgi:hypothetical protein